jgi:hypothetical protein
LLRYDELHFIKNSIVLPTVLQKAALRLLVSSFLTNSHFVRQHYFDLPSLYTQLPQRQYIYCVYLLRISLWTFIWIFLPQSFSDPFFLTLLIATHFLVLGTLVSTAHCYGSARPLGS